MTFAEISNLMALGSLPEVKTLTEVGRFAAINGRIALPLHAISTSFSRAADIEVVDETKSLIGVLCFCRASEGLEMASLTDDKLIAYLADIEKDDFGKPHLFRHDYFVILEPRLFQYQADCMETSPIWGGFLHEDYSNRLPKLYRSPISRIVACPGLKMPTIFHQESAARSTIEPYAFERFLKLYHLLELSFDHSLVEKIKALGDNLQGIGELLSHYSATDTNRLKHVISEKKLDLQPLANQLAKVSGYMANAENIFFDFGKITNPIKERSDFNDLANGGFSEATYKKVKPSGISSYKSLILECTVYFIYRIRCCIAHNKIGEYVIKNSDEEFVVEFGEPLIREVLKQCLSAGKIATPVIAVPAVIPAPAPVAASPPALAPAAAITLPPGTAGVI